MEHAQGLYHWTKTSLFFNINEIENVGIIEQSFDVSSFGILLVLLFLQLFLPVQFCVSSSGLQMGHMETNSDPSYF